VEQRLTRRKILQLSAGLLPLSSFANPASVPATHRRYRIDATIAPFGIAIFSRKEVGYGQARMRSSAEHGKRSTEFEFGGASIPERAHGLQQIGYFEETLSETLSADLGQPDSNYFGFISATPEAAPSKASLAALQHSQSDKTKYCCAVEGRLSDGNYNFSKSYEAVLPEDASPQRLPQVRESVRRSLRGICSSKDCLHGAREARQFRSFLGALIHAATTAESKLDFHYLYGDRVLHFVSTRTADPNAGRNYRHLVSDPAQVYTLRAEVNGKGRHRFTFTYERTQQLSLPLRIEYLPRPWLKLNLEVQPDQETT
jgi:hypothetical protein